MMKNDEIYNMKLSFYLPDENNQFEPHIVLKYLIKYRFNKII